MTDEQATKIVRAAWILGVAMVVAGGFSSGGPWRVSQTSTQAATRAIMVNTWTGGTWQSIGREDWKRMTVGDGLYKGGVGGQNH